MDPTVPDFSVLPVRVDRKVGAELVTRHFFPISQLRVDRKVGAELVTRHFFPISQRTLEIWPLDWRLVNSKAVCETVDLFAVAQAKLDAAPLTRTARRQAA